MPRPVDLRSDTVTLPTPTMREAMFRAELGDDVYGEDPTVNRLEEMAAHQLGMEAALFLLSGTMGNLVGVLAQTQRGDEIIVGEHSHVFLNEAGGCAALGALQLRPVPTQRGRLDPAAVAAAIRPDNVHYPRSSLVSIENTHNRDGGAVVSLADTESVCRVAHEHGLRVHIDGARLFNAAVYLGVPASAVVGAADSVTFCLSKGLSCPAGSLLAGKRDYIQRARRVRKMVGGALRQSGVLAAAGIVALEQMIDRLAEDHEHARALASGLADVPGLALDPGAVQTNIVMVDVVDSERDSATFLARLREQGVLAGSPGGRRVRMVTHYGVTQDDVAYAVTAAARAMSPAFV